MSAASLAAHADSTVPDANLNNPPGVYYGNGNVNGQWTVTDTTGGIEIGLRAKVEGSANIVPDGTLYYASRTTGTHASWNYDFSVNLSGSGLTLADIAENSLLTIKDVNNNSTVSYDPFALVSGDDDAVYDGVNTHSSGIVGTDIGAQNSENLGFSFDKPAGFDPNAADTYVITLDIIGNDSSLFPDGQSLGEDQIEVSTAPLPPVASMGALMLGLVGLGVFFRFRNARKVA